MSTQLPDGPGKVDSRQRQVLDLWAWLPAFRAVAEREHVQHAARDLRITASSLSRAVRLVEETLGKKLFDRVGRNLRLNHDGAALLASLRDGMRLIDDGVSHVLSRQLEGELRLGCEGEHPLGLVSKAVLRLQVDAPLLTATVHDVASGEVSLRLLRGELDLALVERPIGLERVHVDQIATVTYGIYCAKGHPLYSKARRTSLEEIVEHPFVAPTEGRGGAEIDRWPPSVARNVVLRLPALEPAISACVSGMLVVVLPDHAARSSPHHGSLRRLPSEVITSSPLYAIRRQSLGGRDPAAALLAALTTEVASAGLQPVRGTASLRRQAHRPRG